MGKGNDIAFMNNLPGNEFRWGGATAGDAAFISNNKHLFEIKADGGIS